MRGEEVIHAASDEFLSDLGRDGHGVVVVLASQSGIGRDGGCVASESGRERLQWLRLLSSRRKPWTETQQHTFCSISFSVLSLEAPIRVFHRASVSAKNPLCIGVAAVKASIIGAKRMSRS